MTNNSPFKKWFLIFPSFLIYLILGTMETSSLFVKPFSQAYSFEPSMIVIAYSFYVALFATSSAILNPVIQKFHPRTRTLTGGIIFSFGIIGTGLAVQQHSIILHFLFFGVFTGISSGIVFVTVVSNLIKWFKTNQGIPAGLSLMGFGVGSFAASPLLNMSLNKIGLSNTFYLFGFIYLILLIICSFSVILQPVHIKISKVPDQNFPESLHVNKRPVLFLWLSLMFLFTGEIGMVASAAQFFSSRLQLGTAAVATAVGLLGVYNAAGRLTYPTISDYFKRSHAFIFLILMQTVIFILIPFIQLPFLVQFLFGMVVFCYGANVALLPLIAKDFYGEKQIEKMLSILIAAAGLAGFAGPWLFQFVNEKTGNIVMPLYFFGIISFCSFLLFLKFLSQANKHLRVN